MAPTQQRDHRALARWLHAVAEQAPQRVALEAGSVTFTYSQLAAEVRARSAELTSRGFRGGDRVAIAATRTHHTIVSILAAIDAGLAYVPLDLSYPEDRLRAMLEDASPRAVLGEPDALDAVRKVVGTIPTLDNPAASAAVFAAEADLAYVLFTSGSTGRPKGVAMGAAPLAHLIDFHAKHKRLGQPARTLQFAPLSFDVHFQEIFSSIACGGTLVLVPEAVRRDPFQLHAALCDLKIERIFLPYVALQMIADASRERAPEHLKEVVSAGEQLQVTPSIRSLFERLPNAELHNHYGPTESHVVTAHELSGDAKQWPIIPPIGIALPHVELALRDPETGKVTDADTGELLLGGDTLAHGYLGRAELTKERFTNEIAGVQGRWYVTGDLVKRDAAGVYTYLGRADQQLKVDGFRIEPGEIEVVLMAHDAVKEAVVAAPEIQGVGRQLLAYLILRDKQHDRPELPSALRAHLRKSLPEYMIPVRYLTLDKLPITPSGKIDRRSLPIPKVEAPKARSNDPLTAIRDAWRELLGESQLSDQQNLFDIGARSLLVLRFVTRMKEQGINVTVADVYDRPTIAGIAAIVTGATKAKRAATRRPTQRGSAQGIAIVGMATRTAGASDVEAFWDNLLAGREGIRHFAPHELDPTIPESIRSRPNFVPARGALDDADRFDAAFFALSAREATVLDPQQRLMLELSWTALEHAGIDPERTDARIGVYAGSANNSYITALRQEQPELVTQYSEFATMLASEKDYVATRVSHRLNLNGPAVSIHTACSTGLVAVAQAWHALASGQCEVALAGGATVVVPQEGGYLHVEGGMESADGHCRPFDADATGTVFASAGAVVVMKRLEDALEDGDTIYSVIRGVGLNNDGADKASFTAPSVSGQAGAIRMALEQADINPRTIGYVEAHGTGTALGDPIEIAALTRAWREDTADSQFCGIGSVKSNLGHTVAAAGVVGLIKASLALHREVIPATLHFKRANPQIDFAATPFHVIAQNTPWPRGEHPRRAAISSFGVGGTNAHVVIEEGPAAAKSAAEEGRRLYLFPLSARTPDAALKRARDLGEYLSRHRDVALTDVAATLMRGRRVMQHRVAVVARDVSTAIDALQSTKSATAAMSTPRIVFLFPGQGSQHPGMARFLYDEAPAFKDALDRCLAVAAGKLDGDLKRWLIEAAPNDAAIAAQLNETRYAQPALFAVSYALAEWLGSLGIRPSAMIGHSIGEYAAASHASVMSLEDAMNAVIARGAAMFDQPRGSMLAVRADAESVVAMMPGGVEIAGANAPKLTVVAGPNDAIDAFAKDLEAKEIGTTRLRVSHAFHSASMEGALPRVADALRKAKLNAPAIRVYSCVTGGPLEADQAINPEYWARQVRATVQFRKAVEAELAQGDALFVEVGPSQALTALLRQYRTAKNEVPRIVSMLGPAQDPGDPATKALQGVAALWCSGVDLSWPVPASAKRIALPTYPFERSRYWFSRNPKNVAAIAAPAVSVSSEPVAVASVAPAQAVSPEVLPVMSRLPTIEQELRRVMSDVSGISAAEFDSAATFLDQGLDSLSMTQATLELERVFGVRLRFRRLLEDLDTLQKLAGFLDQELPADKFAAPAVQAPAAPAAAAPVAYAAPQAPIAPQAMPQQYMQPMAFAPLPVQGDSILGRQLHLIEQQLQLVRAMLPGTTVAALPSLQPPVAAQPAQAAPQPQPAQPQMPAPQSVVNAPPVQTVGAEPVQPSIKALVEKPFGASARITLETKNQFTSEQSEWIKNFIASYNKKSGKSKTFSQDNRKLMGDPRVVTGFNPLWKDLVYPIVVGKSKGARLWDLDGNEYIDLLSAFGANLLGYQPDFILKAMHEQLDLGIEVGPQHPLSAEVAKLISEFTGMDRVAFCNTGSEAVMGAMRIARTVTGRKTIAIFTNSYHGIFDEVIVRGTKQLRSLSAAPGILANAVENIIVLDYGSDEALKVLKERGKDLAAIMIEPIQNKYPTFQPREFVKSLREIADAAGCALIFDEVVTGFRVAPGGAQEFYGVRADISTFGKVIGGGLPFAAIAGGSRWIDALDGGYWQYGDDSYPEAGVTYFAGTFVRHPLALAAAKASLLHLKKGGRELYKKLNARTQGLIDRLNAAFEERGAPVKAVHCASLWRLQWDDDVKNISLFYYLARFHGLHLYEQFGHFVTEAFGDQEIDKVVEVFVGAMDELMTLGFIAPRPGTTPPGGGSKKALRELSKSAKAESALSPGQTERWLAASFDPNARRALNESFCVRLSGDVDVAALRAALQDVLGRHEAFRVRFDSENPRQILSPEVPIDIAEVDLSGERDADVALDAFCSSASLKEFSLDRPPLAAVSLLTLSDGSRVVHVVANHLIFDGWASSVFNAELAECYRARSIGASPSLKPAESPLEFAQREQERFESRDGQEALQFWKRALANPPKPLLLGDLTPPQPRTFAADTARMSIDGETFTQLRTQARQAGATLFQLLLTAVTVLLQRRGNQDDFVVSIPYASQSLDRHGPLLADGVLDLPLRLGCSNTEKPKEILSRVRMRLMDALEQPLMTQGTVARALGIRSAGDRPPLTGVFFNLNPRVDLSGWAPLTAAMHEGRKRGTLSELFFNFYEKTDSLTLDLHYSAEFFSTSRAQDLVDSLQQICLSLARSLSELPELSRKTDPRVIEWNATNVPVEQGARVEQWIAKQALASPDAIAIHAMGRSLTYKQLDARANQFANVLRERGIGAGQLVGLCLSRGPELMPALLGVLKTGAAYVPLDPGFPKDRLHYMAEDAELKLVITESKHADLAGVDRAHQLRIDDDAATVDAARADALPVDSRWSDDAPTYVIYTSGSTGKPKGVVLPQRAVCNFLASMRREPGMKASDRLLAVTTLSFDIAVLELLLPLTIGATVVIAQRDEAMDGEVLGRMIAEHGITMMQATPTTWHMLLDAGWKPSQSMRALCGGEPLPPALAGRLLETGLELWNMYGPTETTVWSTVSQITDATKKITIGRPIDNTQVWILDERLQQCPIGAEGEIVIGGTGVALGYFKRPELTAEKFVTDPYVGVPNQKMYRTGDLGRWREDGTIEHLGRLDFQVKIRGYRIELGEIEARIEALPGVARSVVMAREDSPGDVRLVGYYVPKAGVQLDAAQMRETLRKGLPDYMLPQHLVALETMPLLPNGKINRKALPAPTGAALVTSRTIVPPRNETERVVAEAMKSVLKLPEVSVEDDFFSLGGHSLLAARMIGQINRDLGLQLGLRTLFESPTVEKLAQAIEKQTGVDAPPARAPIVHRENQEFAPLTLMQQRIHFVEEMNPGSVAYNAPSAHRFKGKMNVEAFDRAFCEMVRRQTALRTAVELSSDGTYVQHVRDDVNASLLPLEDLSNLPTEGREQKLLERVQELAAFTFKLDQAPLYRARLIKLADDDHALFFMPHHVMWDGWSFDVFYNEMSALYEAFAKGEPSPLPELPITYGDFSQWHNEWLASDEIKQQISYWKQQFARFPIPAEPYHDWPRQQAKVGRGATAFMHIPVAQTERIRDLAKQTGSTFSIVALAIYSAMMAEWLRDPNPAIGLPVRGRPSADLDGIMGFFNNMVPLRVPVATSVSCIDWIKQVRKTVTEVFANQDVPFEILAQDTPRLYQVMFSFQDARARQTHWGPLAHSRIPVMQKGATEDINLWMIEIQDGIEGGVQYNAELFLPSTANLLRDRFLELLNRLVEQPQQTIEQLLAPRATDVAVIEHWSKPASTSQSPRLTDALQNAKASVVAGPTRLSSSQLATHVQSVEAALRALAGGIAGKTVVVTTWDPVARVAGALAALRADAKILVARPDEADALLAGSARPDVIVRESAIRLAHAGNVAEVVLPSIADTSFAASRAAHASFNPSGAFAIEAATVDALAAAYVEAASVVEGQVIACGSDVSHAAQLFAGLTALAAGGTVAYAATDNTRDSHELRSWVRKAQAALFVGSPKEIRALTSSRGDTKLPCVVNFDVTEADVATAQDILDTCTGAISVYRSPAHGLPIAAGRIVEAHDAVTFGRPFQNALRVANGDRTAAASVPGSLLEQVGGRWQDTGSVARWRSDGVLQYLAEADGAVIYHGRRVEPKTLERVLESQAQVKRAAVTITKAAHRAVTVHAFIEARGEKPSHADLISHMRRHVGETDLPIEVVDMESLPTRADGSLARDLLTATTHQVVATAQEFVEATTEEERAIADIWAGLLGVTRISMSDNFFLLGGHSLLAVKMLGEVEKRFGVNLPLATLLHKTTAGALAAVLSPTSGQSAKALEADAWRPLVLIKQGSDKHPPVFCIHAVGGNVLQYRELAAVLPEDRTVYGLQSVGLDGITRPIESVPEMAKRYRAEVRTVQPNGPYFLCGGSMGGTIAFEMARQYEAEGEEVAFVGLLDTSGPVIRARTREKPKGLGAQLLGYLRSDGDVNFFGRVQRRLKRMADARDASKHWDRKEALPQETRWRVVEAANFRALSTYTEGPFCGRVVLFRALDEPGHKNAPPDLTWGTVVKGGVEIIDLPGTHNQFIEQPELRAAFRDVVLRLQSEVANAPTQSAKRAARSG